MNKKEPSCLTMLLDIFAWIVISLSVTPYVLVVFLISSKLLDADMVWYEAILSGISWPMYLVDFVVQIILNK